MKRFGVALFIFAVMFSLLTPGIYAADGDARQVIDRLFQVSGQMPVNDMVIELEESYASGGQGSGASSLTPGGKDKIYFKSPNKIRVDSVISDPGGTLDQKTMIIIRDGNMAMNYLANGQYPVKKKPDEPSAPLNIPFGIVHYRQDVDKTYSVTGNESVDGVNTTVIKIVSPSGPVFEQTVWIDKTRCVPLKMLVTVQGSKNDKITKKVLYKDIGKTKDGRFFPMRIEVYQGEELSRVLVYKALAINSGLDDELFAPMQKFTK